MKITMLPLDQQRQGGSTQEPLDGPLPPRWLLRTSDPAWSIIHHPPSPFPDWHCDGNEWLSLEAVSTQEPILATTSPNFLKGSTRPVATLGGVLQLVRSSWSLGMKSSPCCIASCQSRHVSLFRVLNRSRLAHGMKIGLGYTYKNIRQKPKKEEHPGSR